MFVGWLVHHVIPEISSITGWIATNVCTYTQGSQRMNLVTLCLNNYWIDFHEIWLSSACFGENIGISI